MKIVIIGGNAAGMSAASKARRNDPKAEIIVLEKSGDVSYGACGLPYYISGEIDRAESLIAVTYQDFVEKRKIDVRLHHEALAFDSRKKIIQVKDVINSSVFTLSYDRLIICSGAQAVRPGFPGVDLQNVFALRTLQDGLKIKSFIDQSKPRSAVIVGAGYIGLEMAEALGKRNMEVHLVEMLPQVMPNMDADMAQMIEDELKTKHVELYLGCALQALEGDLAVRRAVLADGRKIDTDLVILSIGVRPNVDFAVSGGVELGRSGAIAVDERMQTNLRHVYAAGDCAEAKCRVMNKTTYLPLGTTANKQGRVAGDNASGHKTRFAGITSTSVVKVFDVEAASTGINSSFAEKLKMPVKHVRIVSKSRAGYYPGAQEIAVKLIFDPGNGRLLGAQIAGKEGVAKRIDVLAVAVQQKMTVDEIASLDLSYAPPFAPVWDPVLIAAQQAQKLLQ